MTSLGLKKLFAATCAFAMAGCGGGSSPAGGNNVGGSTGGSAAPPAGPDTGQAAPLIAAYVAENTPRLPYRPSSRQTFTGLRAEGGELVVTLRLSRDMPADMAPDAMARHNEALDKRTACRDAALGEIIRRGGTIRHDVTTPNGSAFQTRVTACP